MHDNQMTRSTVVMNLTTMSITEAMNRIRQLEAEVERLQKRPMIPSRSLNIFQGQRLIRISSRDVAYLRAESNYSHIHLVNGLRYCTSRTLKSWAEELEGEEFIRCHRSFLVNRQVIAEIDVHQPSMLLCTGEQIPTSRRMSRASRQMLLHPGDLQTKISMTESDQVVHKLHRSVA